MTGRTASAIVILLLGLLVIGISITQTGLIPNSAGTGEWTVTPESSPQHTQTQESSSNGDIAPREARLSITIEEYVASDRSLEITVTTEIRGYENLSYENSMLCLYSQNGSQIGSEPLWTIRSPDSGTFYEQQSIEFTSIDRPAYIAIDHPNLRTDSRFVRKTWKWLPSREYYRGYRGTLDGIQDDFEWPRSSEPGQCG